MRYVAICPLVVYGLWRILRFRPHCLLTVYIQDRWILTSYILSRLARIPIIYYVHDPFVERFSKRGGPAMWFVRLLERSSLRHGRVMVLYESLQRLYRTKYGLESVVLPHMTARSRLTQKSTRTIDSITIGFAGCIYDNCRPLLSELAHACREDQRIRLLVLTNAAQGVVKAVGLTQERTSVGFEDDPDRLLAKLSTCDLLYLPLSFKGTSTLPTDSLRYVLPTKAVDYLLAGPPILVHCPESYELARFFRAHGAAYLLHKSEPGALSTWISEWIEGKHPPPAEEAMVAALSLFSRHRNRDVFLNTLARVWDMSSMRPERA